MSNTKKKDSSQLSKLILAKVANWNLSLEDIHALVAHVGDHAWAQGHTRGQSFEEGQSCKQCEELMNRLF